jgi:hypothetical protein
MSNITKNEELNKSIDVMLEEIFAVKSSETVNKSEALDWWKDNKTKADEVVNQAPSMEKDESRNAGRPKQISDVPQNDTDGRRASDYDSAIVEDRDQENEPEETKQSPAIDQMSSQGHIAQSPKAPQEAPFRRSLSEQEFAEYEELKKAKTAQEESKKQEELKKSQEILIKSAVESALSSVKKENDELKKSMMEQSALIKAIASQPRQSKSITNVQALEKSMQPQERDATSFSKSEILDAAEELYKAGSIPMEAVIEIDNTGSVLNPAHKRLIEKKLQG